MRGIVQKNTGKAPERLTQEKKIAPVKKEVKDGYKKMIKEDTSKKLKSNNQPRVSGVFLFPAPDLLFLRVRNDLRMLLHAIWDDNCPGNLAILPTALFQ